MKMNKVIAATLAMSLSLVPTLAMGEGGTFTVFTNKQAFSSTQLKMGKTGRILTPVRNTMAPHGYNIQYQKATNLVTITGKDRTVVLKPNSSQATVKGQQVNLSAPIQIVNGSFCVPFADIPKLIPSKFEWDLPNKTISIVSLTATDPVTPTSPTGEVSGTYSKYGAVNYTYTKVKSYDELATKAASSSDVEVVLLSNDKVVKTIKDFGAFYLSDISSELDDIDDIVVLDHTDKVAFGLK